MIHVFKILSPTAWSDIASDCLNSTAGLQCHTKLSNEDEDEDEDKDKDVDKKEDKDGDEDEDRHRDKDKSAHQPIY